MPLPVTQGNVDMEFTDISKHEFKPVISFGSTSDIKY